MTEGPILYFITFLDIILVIACVVLIEKRKHREGEMLLKSTVQKKVNMLSPNSVNYMALLIKSNLEFKNFYFSMANVKFHVDFFNLSNQSYFILLRQLYFQTEK